MLKRFLFVLLLSLTGCITGANEQPQPRQSAKGGFALLGLLSPNTIGILDPFLSLNINKTAILWRSFGNDPSAFNQWFRSEGSKTVEIHLSNEAGRRNMRLGSSDLLPQFTVKDFNYALETHSRDAEIKKWIVDITLFVLAANRTNPSRFLLSAGLESNYTPLAAMNLVKLISEYWPYEIVYNPINAFDCDYMPNGVLCETHTSSAPIKRPGRCLRSMDGEDSRDRSVILAFIKESEQAGCVTLLWSAETQGTDVPWVPTLGRTFRFNDVEFFRGVLNELH